MKHETWTALNEIDESLYEAKSLLDVMSDGLCNDTVAVSNANDAYATTTRLIYERIERACKASEGLFAIYRGDGYEKPSDVWKEWEGEEAPVRPDDGEVELALQDRDGDGDSGEVDEEKTEGRSFVRSGRLNLTLIEEHPDGSATYQLSGDEKDISEIMSAAFCSLLERGMSALEEKLDEATQRRRVVVAAKALNDILIQWETDEDLDYDPHVKMFRKALTELL
jgi:hypothetical protein